MTKDFLTARAAADLLGVPEAVVVADIERGFTEVPSLIGGKFGETWICYAWQLEGEHPERHRARPSTADRESET